MLQNILHRTRHKDSAIVYFFKCIINPTIQRKSTTTVCIPAICLRRAWLLRFINQTRQPQWWRQLTAEGANVIMQSWRLFLVHKTVLQSNKPPQHQTFIKILLCLNSIFQLRIIRKLPLSIGSTINLKSAMETYVLVLVDLTSKLSWKSPLWWLTDSVSTIVFCRFGKPCSSYYSWEAFCSLLDLSPEIFRKVQSPTKQKYKPGLILHTRIHPSGGSSSHRWGRTSILKIFPNFTIKSHFQSYGRTGINKI